MKSRRCFLDSKGTYTLPKETQHPDTHLLIRISAVALSAILCMRPQMGINLLNWCKTGVNTRKAPAFLRGLLQFD
jgi:hypothetical protein